MFEIPVSISSICVNSIIIKVGPYLTVSDRISGEISPLRLGFELVRRDLFQFSAAVLQLCVCVALILISPYLHRHAAKVK